MDRVFLRAVGQPWLIQPEALQTLLAIADHQGDPAAVEARLGRPLHNTRSVMLHGAVAVIPVTGPIMRYANLFTRISGATSTQVLATDVQAALDNPQVRAIILNIDSPGGEANGISELADLIYAGRSKKRIVSYIGGTGASAAYWVASAAHEVVINDTGIAGSIGVVVEVVAPATKGNEKRYTIVSSNAPNKRPDIETAQGRSEIAKTVDAMANVFTAKVARNLGVQPGRVAAMGDHGGLRVGAAAVKSGLAHRLGSLEKLIAELGGTSASRGKPLPTTVRNTAEFRAALAAGIDPRLIHIATNTDLNAIRVQATLAAMMTERKRITAIRSMAIHGLEDVAATAIDSGMSLEAAALLLKKEAAARKIRVSF